MRRGNPAAGLLLAIGLLFVSGSVAQSDEHLERFYGSFVGTGTAENLATGETEIRDLDFTVAEFKDDGFTVNWITVVRGENGARTGEDVRRREVTENFIPVEDREGMYILAGEGGLFHKEELPNPLDGGVIRWATVSGNNMDVYSLAIGETGSAELQVYRRTLTEKGLDLTYRRLQDENIVVTMTGTLVRAE